MREMILLGLVCAALLPLAQPLYFHIKESETKCFSEELPDETVVVGMNEFVAPAPSRSPWLMVCVYLGTYRCQAQKDDGTFSESGSGVGIHVKVCHNMTCDFTRVPIALS